MTQARPEQKRFATNASIVAELTDFRSRNADILTRIVVTCSDGVLTGVLRREDIALAVRADA